MDTGPVDAGPTDSDYAARPTSYSPERARDSPRAHSARRSDSMRRQATPDSGKSEQRRRSGDPDRRGSSASAVSPADPPQYPRVGATAREASGAARIDGDGDHPRQDGIPPVKDQDSRPHRMHRFTLYETNSRYWITGTDITDQYSRLLRIDRNSPPGQMALFEDETVYDKQQKNDVLQAILEGNKATGGLRQKFGFWGILGFIRFTESYYMLLITKRTQVAMIGGRAVYQIDQTELVPLTTGSSSSFLRDRNPAEARFLGIFNNLDLNKSFYFSYTYDITHSLQHNITRQREAMNAGFTPAPYDYHGMFVWNHHLLRPAVEALKHPHDWCLPIIHGFLKQDLLDVFGRSIYLTIIGRRSRFFAGARFLKRGVNDAGYVANDVETEQIVAEKLTTSFHAPGPKLFSNPTYTSYLHHRGSIPLYWTQDNSGVTPKPGIEINLADPFHQPAALHFDHLFQRYGCPIYVLNLVKSREKTPRESKLLYAFKDCVDYLNESLPAGKRIQYKAYDMARAAKARNGDVIGGLEAIAKEILEQTGFFHNGEGELDPPQVQNGIARTNCIDCLDRTNAAQFVIGKHAFALQLKSLGIIDRDSVLYDTDAVNLFTAMFHDHGDNIAMQYGGSHLVNTMATYRKLGHWQSSSRDMVESFKRYYHNSFLDSQRQEAYNLFLGNYIWAQGKPMLWDLATDYYLHHSDPKAWLERSRRNYIEWYTPAHLEPRTVPALVPSRRLTTALHEQGLPAFDDYWRECYLPQKLSSLDKTYGRALIEVYNEHFVKNRPLGANLNDFSPFVRRAYSNKCADSPDKRTQRKGVTIVDPSEERREKGSLRWESVPLRPNTNEVPGILRESVYKDDMPPPRPEPNPTSDAFTPADKAHMHLWTLNQFHRQSLNPHVSPDEESEYARYISHPAKIPLVTCPESLPSDATMDYVEYINKCRAHCAFDADGGNHHHHHHHHEADAGPFGPGVVSDEDLAYYWEYVGEKSEPLTVTDEDLPKKRYKAYRQWLKGKSLFKQSKVDPQYRAEEEG